MKSFILMVITMVCAISLEAQNKSFYDFNVTTIDGKEFPLSSLKGKKVLVVNVASKCGLTPQYAKLQELYDKYKDKNFVIIGFPANNFMGQEPGSNEEIAQFCSLKYDVTFPMMAKISVKGKNMAPLYQWLTEKKLNGKEDAPVQWNFQKFMIDENGNWVGFVAPQRESALGENRYLDRAGVGAGKRDGIRDTFFNSPSKLGGENTFSEVFFYFFDGPESSAVQFVTGVQFTVVNSFVNKDKFFLTIRFEYIAG